MSVLKMIAVLTLGAAASTSFVPIAVAKKAVKYPMLIDDPKALQSAGLVIGGYGAAQAIKDFKNRCYFYGDGGYTMSVSDEFLDRHKARGFSLNSLCLAFVSGIRFDPETGTRLPTYIYGDFVALKKAGKYPEPGIVTDELPLAVPDCFKAGTPYSDCRMTFDPRTGKKHKDATVAFYGALGQQIEADFKKQKASGNWKIPCDPAGRETRGGEALLSCYTEIEASEGVAGTLARDYWYNPAISQGDTQLPRYTSVGHENWQHQSFADVSPKLPKGFGYALYADGGAGSDPEAETLESVQAGSSYATSAEIASAAKTYP
jgi:hypothetical protein